MIKSYPGRSQLAKCSWSPDPDGLNDLHIVPWLMNNGRTLLENNPVDVKTEEMWTRAE